MKWLVALLVAAAAIGGAYYSVDSSDRPWIGYARHKSDNTYELWAVSYQTHRDCIEGMKWGVSNPPQQQWYAEPVGCGYFGNDWWYVALMNRVWGGDQIKCIARVTDKEAAAGKRRYSPMITSQKRGDGWYCV